MGTFLPNHIANGKQHCIYSTKGGFGGMEINRLHQIYAQDTEKWLLTNQWADPVTVWKLKEDDFRSSRSNWVQ